MDREVREAALDRLRQGLPPLDEEALETITVGDQDGIWDFWRTRYLKSYIADGGSKVKFLIGRQGSGKTHALLMLQQAARQLGYVSVFIDTRLVRLNKFDSIYQAVFDQVDIQALVTGYCSKVLEKLGYNAGQVPPGQDFLSWVVEEGRAAETIRRETQEQLDGLYHDRNINHNFAIAFVQLCTDYLGTRRLVEHQREILDSWLKGRPLPAKVLKPLKIFTRIDKFNARHMMSSFLYLLRLCGKPGLCVTVDSLEALLERGPNGRALYGKAARNEVYESLRQLVDDFAGFEGAFFVFASRLDLIHDEKSGFKSYEALWMRIQNEVSGNRPNKFADLFNQDDLVKEFFTVDTCLDLQDKLSRGFNIRATLGPEDFRCLVDTVSMFSPLGRAVEAMINSDSEGGEPDGSI